MQIRVYCVVISHLYSTRAVAQYFYPYYFSVLSHALVCFFPTFLEIAVRLIVHSVYSFGRETCVQEFYDK